MPKANALFVLTFGALVTISHGYTNKTRLRGLKSELCQ